MAEHLGYRQSMVSCMAYALDDGGATVVPTAISPYMWHPMPVAMAMATIAEAAPGRAAIALGTGNPMFLAENGLQIEKPVRVMREFVEALRALWSNQPVQYRGETLSLAGARMMFDAGTPIPIYIAAMGEQMLKLSGRIADGVVLSAGLSTTYTARSLALTAEGATAAGRDPAAVRKAAYIYTVVSTSPKSAYDTLRPKLAFLLRNKFLAENVRASGIEIDQEAVMAAVAKRDLDAATRLVPDEAVEAFAIGGSLADCRKRLDAYLDAGVTEPVLVVLGTDAERTMALDLMRELATA
jgi:5,10-methylenetetrahydromethanopterin reductase